MAISATIDVTSPYDQAVPGLPLTVTVRVFNSGASTVNVTDIRPYVTPLFGGYLVSSVEGPSTALAAATATYFQYRFIPLVPRLQTNAPTTVSFTLGAIVSTDDNAVCSAPTTTVVVGKPNVAQPTLGNGFIFDSDLDSGYVALL